VEIVIEDRSTIRPGQFCRFLLRTLDAADAQTRRRKRDQRPDHIGLALRRHLLEQAIVEDPDQSHFEQWLLEQVLNSKTPGALRAMATLILDEFRFAGTQPEFTAWLQAGAPSADADEAPRVKRDHEVMTEGRGSRSDFDADEHWCPICSSEHVRNG
jgi:hypothetical protein